MRTGAVLRSKLRRPGLPGDLVPRPRMNEAFAAATALPLTVVLAPVGFGKTTAAALWAAQTPLPTAWLALDEQDADHVRLLRHLVAALRTVHPGFGDGLDALLLLPEVPDGGALGEALADAMHDLPERTGLVIDDAHLASSPESAALLQALVRYPAPELALVLVTRSAALIDLGKLLAHAQAASIDAAMLRFTPDEAAGFLASHGVSPEAARGLEGWAAGLRLAAMTGGAPAAMEQAGAASRELLMDAALEQTPPDHLEPLLAAAAVERISGELCAAMLGRPMDAPAFRAMLAHLAAGHAFLVQQDRAGEWFAIEPLFRGALLERARAHPGAAWIAEARRAASDWFTEHGDIDAAITHALLGGDVDRAATLVEEHAFTVEERLHFSLLEMWLARLPEATVATRPRLLLARGVCLMIRGASVAGMAVLDRAEALLAAGPAGERVALRPFILATRANIMMTSAMNLDGALAMLDEARALLPEGGYLGLGTEIHVPAMADVLRGDPGRAIASIEGWAREHHPPNDAYATSVPMTEAVVYLLDGNPIMAAEAAVRLGEIGRKVGLPSRQTWAASLEGNALLAMNALPEAEEAFDRHQALAYSGLMTFTAYQDAVFGRALLFRVTGRGAEALEIADRYIRLLSLSANHDLLTLARSFRARLAALDGEIDAAMAILAALPTPTGRQPMSLVESVLLTRARVLATWGERSGVREAVEICRRKRGRSGRLVGVRARTVEAWALEALGEGEAAEETLAEALALGIGRGLVRPFVEDGERIGPILRRLEAGGNLDAAVALALIPREGRETGASGGEAIPSMDTLVLTRRELEVLHALRRGLTNKQIAEELFIAQATVKRHMVSLFRKLGVTTRTQAVLHPQSVEIFRRSV